MFDWKIGGKHIAMLSRINTRYLESWKLTRDPSC